MPWASVCARQVRDLVPEHFSEAVARAKASGAAAWTFHTRLSFDLKTESLRERLQRPEHRELARTLQRVTAAARSEGTWPVAGATGGTPRR